MDLFVWRGWLGRRRPSFSSAAAASSAAGGLGLTLRLAADSDAEMAWWVNAMEVIIAKAKVTQLINT